MQILDGGRAYDGGNPPADIRFGKTACANPRKDAPAQTILGVEQKAWFKERLRRSTATWKIWGNSSGTLDGRADPQNLPPGITSRGRAGTMRHSGAAIGDGLRGARRDLRRRSRREITGFAIVSGDRHSFWAGYAAKALPPRGLRAGRRELRRRVRRRAPAWSSAYEHGLPKDHPLRRCSWPIGRAARPDRRATCCSSTVSAPASSTRRPAISRARRACRTRPVAARVVRRPGRSRLCESPARGRTIAPNSSAFRGRSRGATPRMAARCAIVSSTTATLWRPGERPQLQQEVLEGDPGLAI